MYFGRLPQVSQLSKPRFERGKWSREQLEAGVTDGASSTSRRVWFLATCGALTTASLGWLVGRESLAVAAPAKASDVLGAGRSPLPAWHAEMLRLGADALLRRAGEFERLSRPAIDNAAIAPGFLRLLDLATASRLEIADAACACAVRTLAKLGRHAEISSWLRTAPGFVEARREADYVLTTFRREEARRRRVETRREEHRGAKHGR